MTITQEHRKTGADHHPRRGRRHGNQWANVGHPLGRDPGPDGSPATLDPWKRLAAAILAKAAEEARAGDIGACMWLISDGLWIAEMLGFAGESVLEKVASWSANPAGEIKLKLYIQEA
jgi:hypothetical protein